MRVDYTLPGVLPDVTPEAAPGPDAGEGQAEPFGAQLQSLRVPEVTDWRDVLRLNASPGGAAHIGPPAPPYGIHLRDGASQRAWWRGMLRRHAEAFEGAAEPEIDTDGNASVMQMFKLLSESQRREDAIFARYFAESRD